LLKLWFAAFGESHLQARSGAVRSCRGFYGNASLPRRELVAQNKSVFGPFDTELNSMFFHKFGPSLQTFLVHFKISWEGV
jgi:hypothetical protein